MNNPQLTKLAKKYETPLYVYDEAVIEAQFKKLQKAVSWPHAEIHYAVKANPNVHILKLLKKFGAFIDATSPGEIYAAEKAGFKPKSILYTGNNLTDEELKYAISKNIFTNVDSLSQLDRYGRLNPGSKVGVRLNPEFGAGHHDHVITAGKKSRFGIAPKDIGEIKKIAKKHNLKITGLHQHIGSGVLDWRKLSKAVGIMFELAENFDSLEFLDFGGGLGVPYKPDEKPLDVEKFGKALSEKFAKFAKKYSNEKLKLYLEPGRYLVAQSAVLLVQVTALKKNPQGNTIVGTNSGMTHLMRPALYGSYHHIENISNPKGRKEKVTVVGDVCESTDVFAKERQIAKIREGDILAIRDTGAYGMAMASRFNGRLLPAEVLVSGNREKVIRKRDSLEDLTQNM